MKKHLGKLLGRIAGISDLMLCGALVAVGLWLIVCPLRGMDSGAEAALAGALFGGAAILLGNWINRYNEWRRATTDLEQRRAKVMALIVAELVDVAAGLIDAKRVVDAACTSLEAGGTVGEKLNMTWIMPRYMPFTESLGLELLILEQPVINALVTLRSNLSITRLGMEEITEGRESFGFLRITALSNGLGHDMRVLAKVFELTAPDHEFVLGDDQPPELVTTILNRSAGPV